jgi:hypothetical protein
MPIRWAYLKRVLAGAIFGLYIANLLYFLNPQIDITPGRLATVTIVYGLICGLLFGTALWLLRILRVRFFRKPETDGAFRPHGFGFVVLAAFLAAAIYWMHLEVFRIYLPVGAIRVLSKATNLITGTAFALLLIWFAERNATRRTSRILFLTGVVLIAVSSVFLYERRDSYRTERAVVVAEIGTVAGQRPVIVVAIRNLPYDWILTLAGEGSLPFFDQARTHGYLTRLEPFPTISPKSLWASVATGKLPFRHGVTGRLGYATPLNRPGERFLIIPAGVGFKVWGLIPPVRRISTPLPAGLALPLWTLFERAGLRTTVIGWPWSEPVGASRIVTDRYFDDASRNAHDVVPPQFAAEIARLHTVPPDSETQRFNGTGNARPRIVTGLAADLTSMAVLRASAPAYPLAICTLGGFEQAQRAIHIFSDDLPPRSNVKGLVLRAYAEQLDRMLSELARDFPNHMIVVVSASGPVPPELAATPYALLRDFVNPEDPSSDDGFVLIHGSGVVHNDRPRSALAVDLVPTVLYVAGLPVGRDMDGSVLSEAFSEEMLRGNPLSLVQTYEAQRLVIRRSGG